MHDTNRDYVLSQFQTLLPLIAARALDAIAAITILVLGLWLSGKASSLVVRGLGRTPHFDDMLRSFFGSLARYAVLTATVLAVLSRFGIQTTSIVAVLGAAGLAVGLALQGTLSNLAAGVMLLIFRPFRIGHKVQLSGATGTVRELTLFWTEIVADDQQQIILPNSGVWGQPLRNFSVYPGLTPGGEARIRLRESADLDNTLAAARAIALAHPKIIQQPPPALLVDRTAAENALEIVILFKTGNGDDIPAIRSDLFRAIHEIRPPPAPPPQAVSIPLGGSGS